MKAPGRDEHSLSDKQLAALWGTWESQVRFYKTTKELKQDWEGSDVVSVSTDFMLQYSVFFAAEQLYWSETALQLQFHDATSASVALRKGLEAGCRGNVGPFFFGLFQEFLKQSFYYPLFICWGDFSPELGIFQKLRTWTRSIFVILPSLRHNFLITEITGVSSKQIKISRIWVGG